MRKASALSLLLSPSWSWEKGKGETRKANGVRQQRRHQGVGARGVVASVLVAPGAVATQIYLANDANEGVVHVPGHVLCVTAKRQRSHVSRGADKGVGANTKHKRRRHALPADVDGRAVLEQLPHQLLLLQQTVLHVDLFRLAPEEGKGQGVSTVFPSRPVLFLPLCAGPSPSAPDRGRRP